MKKTVTKIINNLKIMIKNVEKFIFKKILICLVGFLIIFTITFLVLNNKNNNKSPDDIFATEEYMYLPKEAYNYVVNYYNETGIILRTEKNKEENVPYLNPEYIDYLDNGSKASESGYIPEVTITDVDYLKVKLGSTALPSKYDSRNVDGKSYVTSVKNQSGHGLCWAFSETSVLESKILKEGLWKESKELDLSERQIDYVTATPSQAVDIGINPYFKAYGLDNLGDTGNWYRYFNSMFNGIAPITEEKWGKNYETNDKYSPNDIWNLEKVGYSVDEYYNFSTSGSSKEELKSLVNIIKQHIIENGSVEMSLPTAHGSPAIQYEPTHGEELTSPNTTKYNVLYYRDETYAYSNDHSVAIIGWDDNYTHNVCVNQNGKLSDSTYSNGVYECESGTLKTIHGAWIMKNSYGEEKNNFYAFNPHAYVAFESIGVTYSSINKVSKKNYDNVYLKSINDKSLPGKSELYYEKPDKIEKITKIKFDTPRANTTFDFSIDFNGDGNYTSVGTINTTYKGIYSLDLSPINEKLTSQNFSIKITYDNNYGYIVSDDDISIYTKNVDSGILIDMEDAKIENTIQNQVIKNALSINENNIVMLNGISRSLTNDKRIEFSITKNGVDFTDKFKFYRNYEVSNYINTIAAFNNDVPKGTYNVTASVDGKVYDNFTLKINEYIENLEGTGTEDAPYLIKNATQLDMIRTDQFSFYKLANDIDLTYATQNKLGEFYNAGKGWTPISYSNSTTGAFSGGLDGNGYSIIGLYINRPDEDYVGLFSRIDNENYSNLYIKNLNFKDSNIIGKKYVGALSGSISPGTLERNLNLKNIGIINGQIKGASYVGGISGFLRHAGDKSDFRKHYYDNLYNSSTVKATENYAGGLFGSIDLYPTTNSVLKVNFNNIFNVGNVSSSELSGGIIGAFYNYATSHKLIINNCYNTGTIKGSKYGEIIGESKISSTDELDGRVELNNVYYYNTNKPYGQGDYSTTNVERKNYKEISDANIYSSWTDFDANWNLLKQSNQGYFPTLKNVKITHIKNMSTINDEILINSDNINNVVQNISVNIDDEIANKELYYYSEDEKIATVTQDGKVNGIGSGTTNIVVISKYDGTALTIPVTISKTVVNVESVSLNKHKLTLEDTIPVALETTVSPSDATNKNVTWISSNPKVATVDNNGNITAKKNGETTITATTVDGNKTAECIVTVDLPAKNVTGITINKQSLSLKKGESEKLAVTITPSDATNKNVTWTSSNSAVAMVDNNGTVTALSAGKTVIIATTEDGHYTVKSEVTVTNPKIKVTGITINKQSLSLKKGASEKLTAIISPSDATNKNVTWTSSNSAVAMVDNNGTVTALSAGETIITIITEDGRKTETCKVTVSNSRLKGDVNNDGKVTIADVSLLYRHVRGTKGITDNETLAVSELTDDGKVTIADVARLYRYVRGKVTEL